jgi:hypothetical protein
MEAPLSRGRFCFPPAGFGAVSQLVRRSLFGAIPRIARIQQRLVSTNTFSMTDICLLAAEAAGAIPGRPPIFCHAPYACLSIKRIWPTRGDTDVFSSAALRHTQCAVSSETVIVMFFNTSFSVTRAQSGVILKEADAERRTAQPWKRPRSGGALRAAAFIGGVPSAVERRTGRGTA